MNVCKRCGGALAYPGAEYCGAACSTQRNDVKKCSRCDGCGKIADSDDGEPWTAWEALPPGSDIAVTMGIVKPIPCPDCEWPEDVHEAIALLKSKGITDEDYARFLAASEVSP